MSTLEEIAPAFVEMAHRIVWCTVATLDGDGRPRTRILHPIWGWDGTDLTGWIATARTPLKVAGLEESPHVSLTYWDPTQDTCTADCAASWIDDDDERARLWDRFVNGPEPVGYDPAIIPAWADGPSSPAFSGLCLTPNRLRVMPGSAMAGAGGVQTWHS